MTTVNDDRAEWLHAAAEAHRDAVARERMAAGMLRDYMHAAHVTGMSLRAISAHVGLSHQRVAQIIGKRGGA